MEQAETPSTSRGYYCHSCNNTISIPITNFLCPDCHQGFIEKLPDGPTGSSPFSERGTENRDDMDADPVVVLNRVFDDISSNLEVIMGGGESNGRNTDNRPSSSSRRDTLSNSSRPNERRRGRNQHTATFEQMLSEFLNNIPRNPQNFDGGAPVLLVGNPGDYAWGREGLDTIVTQLLNQMDSSGPPPLAKDKINELPFVSITAQQVSENMQCSVCWDSFKVTEKVRQLPCDHIYHDLCIVPWLELHGTCPICRKLLSDDNEARLGFPHAGGLEALLSDVHRLSILQQTYTPSSSTSTGGGTGFSRRNNNVRCFRCNKIGHFARDCTAPQPAQHRQSQYHHNNQSNSTDRCFRCDGWGHVARNCPETLPRRRRNRSQSRGRGGWGSSRRAGSANRGGSWSDSMYSPSRAVPLHEFWEVDYSGADDEDDYLSDSMSGSDMLEDLSFYGVDFSDHVPEVCALDTMFQIDSWDNDTVSPSGGSSSNSAANFVGYRQINNGGSRGSRGAGGSVANNDRKRKMTCYKCNKLGHMARDCWKRNCQRCSKNYNVCECSDGPTLSSNPNSTATTATSSWSTRPNNYNSNRSNGGLYPIATRYSRFDPRFEPLRSDDSAPTSNRTSFNASTVDRCDRCYKNHRTSDCWFLREPTPDWCKSFRSNNANQRRPPNRGTFDGSGPSTSRFHQQSGPNNHENYRCFHCQEIGHIARNCPTAKSASNEGRVRVCHTCGAQGHFSRDCRTYL
ncbi:uncharacterized protein LOC135846227 [Planococcus citri]|uniref:uncharacterized protein LOC135846227 n=1 Tax=Planococcus citri TaxID=170843 RepID=UPI0031F9B6DE